MPLAQELRTHLADSPNAVRRVFHGRGKAFAGYEHLNIEWYPPYLFVQNFGDPLDDQTRQTLQNVFDEFPMIAAVLVQSREWPDFTTHVLCARQPVELPVSDWVDLDNNLLCQMNLGKNRNTGMFLDMRAGWHWVKEHAADKNVLNLFSYTGVFSLFALAGGANKVDNVDMAANVLKIAQRNHQKNNLHEGKAAFYKRSILKSDRWFESRQPYDLIIIDPPPYQKKAFHGWRDYQKLLEQCRKVLADNGVFFTCLNNPQITLSEFVEDLKLSFPNAKSVTPVATAPEIKEPDPERGLKTVVVQF